MEKIGRLGHGLAARFFGWLLSWSIPLALTIPESRDWLEANLPPLVRPLLYPVPVPLIAAVISLALAALGAWWLTKWNRNQPNAKIRRAPKPQKLPLLELDILKLLGSQSALIPVDLSFIVDMMNKDGHRVTEMHLEVALGHLAEFDLVVLGSRQPVIMLSERGVRYIVKHGLAKRP